MHDIKYITPAPGWLWCVVNIPDCFTALALRQLSEWDIVRLVSMRVKYSQTPPPVLEEADGMVQVTKQLTQVRDNN